jgi:hypothetical protein
MKDERRGQVSESYKTILLDAETGSMDVYLPRAS